MDDQGAASDARRSIATGSHTLQHLTTTRDLPCIWHLSFLHVLVVQMTPTRKLLLWTATIIIFAAFSYPIRLLALRLSTISLSRSPLAPLLKFSPGSQSENYQVHPPLPSTFSFAYANVSATNSDKSPYYTRTLWVASRIYIVSLPRRIDRRTRMEALFNFMNLDFTWWDATSSQDAIVGEIMERVRWERVMHVIYTHWGLLPQSSLAQAVDGEFGSRVPVQTQHGFKSVSEVEAEDPIYWDEDAVTNPHVYPPIHANDDSTRSISPKSSNDSFRISFHIDIEQERPGNGTPDRPLELAGSELWTLDPLRDARSTQRTNPIPRSPCPDLRLPLPCAPLHFAFDMPSMEDPDWEIAEMADAIMQHDDIDNDEGGDFSNSLPLTPRGLNYEDLERESAAEETEDDLDEDSSPGSPRLRRHSMAPKSPYPFHLTLSRAMIACWNSHFRLLRHIADGSDDIAIVLEDDVDMEYDLPKILNRLSGALPAHWDIVFLGTCNGLSAGTFVPRAAGHMAVVLLMCDSPVDTMFGFFVQVIVGRPTKTSSLHFPLRRFPITRVPVTQTIRDTKISPFAYTLLLRRSAPMHMQYRVLARLESSATFVQPLRDHLCAHHRMKMTLRQKHQQVPKTQISRIKMCPRREFYPRFTGLVSLMAAHWIKRLSV
jgi:hypothetical protein